ncbi:hypothetical protein DFH09DRAFT_1098662 [Mycena vulgaris]|nr:hypothetical protein DFH09DRAFT_1098662 [Mycena vulgaris]
MGYVARVRARESNAVGRWMEKGAAGCREALRAGGGQTVGRRSRRMSRTSQRRLREIAVAALAGKTARCAFNTTDNTTSLTAGNLLLCVASCSASREVATKAKVDEIDARTARTGPCTVGAHKEGKQGNAREGWKRVRGVEIGGKIASDTARLKVVSMRRRWKVARHSHELREIKEKARRGRLGDGDPESWDTRGARFDQVKAGYHCRSTAIRSKSDLRALSGDLAPISPAFLAVEILPSMPV